MAYLTTLSVAQTVRRQTSGYSMNNTVETICPTLRCICQRNRLYSSLDSNRVPPERNSEGYFIKMFVSAVSGGCLTTLILLRQWLLPEYQTARLFLCWNNYALRNEGAWGSGGVAPLSWPSTKLISVVSFTDRLCGLVVRVLGYRSGGPGSIPGTTRFSEQKKKKGKQVVGLERGALGLVSTTEELLDKKVAAPV
jgi:hypothetical protein